MGQERESITPGNQYNEASMFIHLGNDCHESRVLIIVILDRGPSSRRHVASAGTPHLSSGLS
jgi:hypothetical protein